jgi:hypothetical protein
MPTTAFRSNENHRQAKQFKKVIYIALSQWSCDLPLADDGGTEDVCDSDDEDTSSEDTHNASVEVKVGTSFF